MGQKVNPHTIRVGINREWESVWYNEMENNENFVINEELFDQNDKE